MLTVCSGLYRVVLCAICTQNHALYIILGILFPQVHLSVWEGEGEGGGGNRLPV